MQWFVANGKVQVNPQQDEDREGREDEDGPIRMPVVDDGYQRVS